jgi:hypothetical protein
MLNSELSATKTSLVAVSAMLNGTSVAVESKKNKNDLMTPTKFLEEYSKNPSLFLNRYGNKKLLQLKQVVDAYAQGEKGRKSVATYINNMNTPVDGELSASLKMDTYTQVLKSIAAVDSENVKIIKNKIKGVISVGNSNLNDKLADALLNGVTIVSEKEFLKRTQNLVKDLPKRNKKVDQGWLPNRDFFAENIDAFPNNLSKSEKAELQKRLNKGKKEWGNKLGKDQESRTIVKNYIDELNNPASEIGNIYKSLSKEYNNIVTSNEIKRYDIIGKTSAGGKTAKYSMDLQTVEILPKVPGAVGNAMFNETIKDITGFNQSDPNTYTATLGGISKGTLDASKELGKEHTQKIINLIKVLAQKEKPGRSYLSHALIAGEDSNKSAMIFKFSPEAYKDLIITKSNPGGLITAEDANRAVKNGISFVAPNNYWTNTLAKKSRMGPIEGIINAQGEKGFKYVSPIDPNNLYIITANANMPGGYKIQQKIRVLQPDGTYKEGEDYVPSQNYGGNIELIPNVLNEQIMKLESRNNLMFNQINQSKK